MILWIDEKSVLRNGKEQYRTGDIVPDGVLSHNRIKQFKADHKIKVIKEEIPVVVEVKEEIPVVENSVVDEDENSVVEDEEITETIEEDNKNSDSNDSDANNVYNSADIAGGILSVKRAPDGTIQRFSVEYVTFFDKGFYKGKNKQRTGDSQG